MKNIITLAVLLISLIINAQVGINNTSPKATLDITAKTNNGTKPEGLIAPRLSGDQIQSGDVQYDTAQKGAIIYALSAATSPSTKTANINAEGYYYFDGSLWQKLSNSSVPAVVVTSSALNGVYKAGTAMTVSNTFTVTLTNNSFSTATIAFSTSDLVLSGVTGLSVASVSTASSTLIAGASVTVTYTLSGTPASSGTLAATWTKLSLSSVKTAMVSPNAVCASGQWSSVSPAIGTNGLRTGTTYSAVYSIPYTMGAGNLPAESYTSNGLTFTLTNTNPISSSGNLTYSISGTYTGTDKGMISFTTQAGCTVKFGVTYTASYSFNISSYNGVSNGTFNVYQSYSSNDPSLNYASTVPKSVWVPLNGNYITTGSASCTITGYNHGYVDFFGQHLLSGQNANFNNSSNPLTQNTYGTWIEACYGCSPITTTNGSGSLTLTYIHP
ncbi:hypothetical protein SAMN05421856_111104 [Chryseobacterium taichungense]|uniref:Uncharacterized protein n=1 Tax=Chryseobacterium taichungense TaxID=295069 RepID=A0A1H8D391_9FLAO|nr:hypothetical protein [Chryseobacterium taichungense]SEN01871.1 hypothetical protein SAMN05421856_111104 [Chryseobacterium taichungense]